MTTPLFWRRATFSVAETAELIGATEDGLRAWIARNPLNDFNGAKTGGRLWLSGNDGFYYSLVQTLTLFGVPVRTAMYTAATIADETYDGPPSYKYLTVQVKDRTAKFESTDDPDIDGPALLMPLHTLYNDHMARCAEANAREAA